VASVAVAAAVVVVAEPGVIVPAARLALVVRRI
jgi:hypothetical protein